MRIALIATCLADAMFLAVAKATASLLERLGHQVVFPAGQTCCGQMHINTGHLREALRNSPTWPLRPTNHAQHQRNSPTWPLRPEIRAPK